eukprot:TRINITY_DN3980_c0_g3_i2.p1 TRINITY_DN3980_c0_g3~~TRINITY_DN3980_c0_g3_i2.p1  ORF type:complete len:689 (+),score=156.74 TRINITY_DN3980_c0_g3_i2:81-2069(+)
MESFLREPSRLAGEQSRIVSEMVDVAVKHYPLFIGGAKKCSDILQEAVKDVELTERLINEEEELKTMLVKLSEKGDQWKRGKHQLLVLRTSQEQIRDLFELPTLLENCLRDGMYQEAYQIQEKVESLVGAAPGIPVLQSIASDTEETIQRWIPQLITKLSTDLNVVQCYTITNFLSRLKLMTDPELQKLYLARRVVYLDSLFRDLSSPLKALNSINTIIGTKLPNIITEYEACFRSKDANSRLTPFDTKHDTPATDILGSWLAKCCTDYLELIQKNVNQITMGDEVKLVMIQSLESSKALAGKGVDIRPILYKIFSMRLLNLWDEKINHAYECFELSVGNHVWSKKVTTHSHRKQDRTAPPNSVRQYLPLAYLTNGLLVAFNELRRCCLSSLVPLLLCSLSKTLCKAVGLIKSIYHTQSLDSNELSGYLDFVKTTIDDFLPFISRGVDILLGSPKGVDVKEISRPISDIYRQHVMPRESEAVKGPDQEVVDMNALVSQGSEEHVVQGEQQQVAVPGEHPQQQSYEQHQDPASQQQFVQQQHSQDPSQLQQQTQEQYMQQQYAQQHPQDPSQQQLAHQQYHQPQQQYTQQSQDHSQLQFVPQQAAPPAQFQQQPPEQSQYPQQQYYQQQQQPAPDMHHQPGTVPQHQQMQHPQQHQQHQQGNY